MVRAAAPASSFSFCILAEYNFRIRGVSSRGAIAGDLGLLRADGRVAGDLAQTLESSRNLQRRRGGSC